MRNIRRVIGITAVLVLGLMTLGATVVLAAPLVQEGEPAQTDPEAESPEVDGEDKFGFCDISREVMQEIFDREVLQAAIAETLGMTVEELEEAKENGQRMPEILEEEGVTVEELQTAVQEARDEMVQQALDDELITAEHAECILSHEGGPCLGKFGRGFRRGFRQGFESGNAAPLFQGTSLNS